MVQQGGFYVLPAHLQPESSGRVPGEAVGVERWAGKGGGNPVGPGAQPPTPRCLCSRTRQVGSVKCDVGQLHGTVAKEIAVSMVVVNTSVSPAHNLREPAPYRGGQAEPCDVMRCIL